MRVLVHSFHPKRQPAMPGLQCPNAKLRVAIHDSRSDQSRRVTLTAPRMRHRALHEVILPCIVSARRVRGHRRKRVQRYREIVMLGGGPDGLKIRVIDGSFARRIDENCEGPGLLGTALDFPKAVFDITEAHENYALDSGRI